MAFVDPNTVHNPAVGTVAPAAWGDQVRDDIMDLDSRATSGLAVSTSQTTTSTTFTDLATAGPAVTITTGARIKVEIRSRFANNTANDGALMSFAISGATTLAASDATSVGIEAMSAGTGGLRCGGAFYLTVTPGSNTVTAKYRAVTAGTATFADRELIVTAVNKMA